MMKPNVFAFRFFLKVKSETMFMVIRHSKMERREAMYDLQVKRFQKSEKSFEIFFT